MNKTNAFLTATTLTFTALAITKYLKHKKKKQLQEITTKFNSTDSSVVYKIFFVTQKNGICDQHIFRKVVCGSTCSYLYIKNIISVIESAKTDILVCMYHLSLQNAYDALINAKARGIQVRVISDLIMLQGSGSKVKALINAGIPVKVQQSRIGLMHHKFLLVDHSNKEKARLLFGSLNYSLNAFVKNWEFVIMTSDKIVIEKFSNEFESLWNDEDFVFPN